MTLSRRGYYRYLFYAQEGDAVAFTACPTPVLGAVLAAASKNMPVATPNPERVSPWLWSGTLSEETREEWADLALSVGAGMLLASGWDNALAVDPLKFPHGLNATATYLASRGLKLGLHMHPDIV